MAPLPSKIIKTLKLVKTFSFDWSSKHNQTLQELNHLPMPWLINYVFFLLSQGLPTLSICFDVPMAYNYGDVPVTSIATLQRIQNVIREIYGYLKMNTRRKYAMKYPKLFKNRQNKLVIQQTQTAAWPRLEPSWQKQRWCPHWRCLPLTNMFI